MVTFYHPLAGAGFGLEDVTWAESLILLQGKENTDRSVLVFSLLTHRFMFSIFEWSHVQYRFMARCLGNHTDLFFLFYLLLASVCTCLHKAVKPQNSSLIHLFSCFSLKIFFFLLDMPTHPLYYTERFCSPFNTDFKCSHSLWNLLWML